MKGGDKNKPKEIQGIIRNYFEKLHSNKLGTLEEMDIFIDTNGHPKLNKAYTNHLNRSITRNKIKAAIKNFQKKNPKYPGPDEPDLKRRTNVTLLKFSTK
jgi:hypothetical protein